jgi:hypothetical protein
MGVQNGRRPSSTPAAANRQKKIAEVSRRPAQGLSTTKTGRMPPSQSPQEIST